MNKDLNENYLNIETKDRLFFYVLALFPLSLILGNLLINIFIFLLSVSFFLNFKESKYFLKNKIIYVLIFFFISLIINLIFSTVPLNSAPRVIKIFFIILLVVETLRIFNKYNEKIINKIFMVWSVILVIVFFDCIFEIIFGFNTLGFNTTMPGRVASFFGDELVVGGFINGFALFLLSYLIIRNSNNLTLALFIIGIVITSFLIGERSNFIKLFFSIVIFSAFAIRANFFQKILSVFFLIALFLGILNFSETYKYRYYEQIKNLYQGDGLVNYYKKTQYGAHQDAALKIFKNFPVFGVGIKNFRYESNKEIYINSNISASDVKQATHPHQLHLELLSETGLFGYFSFLTFIILSLFISIKSFLKKRNIFQLASILFIITSLMPILPSGSFLSTFNSAIFWINFSVMVGFSNILKFKS